MTHTIPAGKMEAYKRTARRRWQAEQERVRQRRERAWQLARQAADLLKTEYGVTQVRVFGSLIHPGRFNQWSDVDLAAWGLTSSNWLRAMAAVRALSDEIEVNLVDVACCSPALLKAIKREGVEL